MTNKRTIVTLRKFWLLWIAANGIAGTIAAALLVGIFALVWHQTAGVPDPWFSFVLVSFPFWFGAVLGAATGVGQAIVLHRKSVKRKHWLLRSCAGATMGVPLGLLVSLLLLAACNKTFRLNTAEMNPNLLEPIWFSSMAAIAGTIHGLAQLAKPAILRGSAAWRWVIANGLGYTLGMLCGSYLAIALFSHLDFEGDVHLVQGGLIHLLWNREVVIGCSSGVLNGVITGIPVSGLVQCRNRSTVNR